ncbi:protein spire homolog 1-like [Notechis scutatus]|uniref:Protein spire homolog 1-like n=1 Tax=Notechis scutatus TaxID=8663 RepID=A0A6J1VCC3_9SAUR|nr:protein spire homolog 1-like [Notechis scutatus]
MSLTESLGKLIYKALDWGIESYMERELSESLAKLITLMLKLNAETSNTTVALQDICEDHFHKPSEAASHYTTICQMLFSEYIELQKLTLTIQSCKEYLGRMDVEDCSARQKTNNSKSMRLQKVMGQTLHSIPPGEGILSSYSMVVDDIKNKRYSLHAVSVWKLKEKTSQEFSLHEKLMMEVKNPPKLQPIFEQKSSNNYKGDTQKFVLNSPCNSIISEQNISINFSKAKKTQLSCTHSDLELKTKLGKLCEDGGSETKMSMPVRPCVRLPLHFFKMIHLGKEDDQGLHNQKTAQLEVEQWDSSRIPLVFEPHCLTPPFACRIKSMRDWPSMDICIKCEQYLLEMLSHHSPCRKRRLSWTELE